MGKKKRAKASGPLVLLAPETQGRTVELSEGAGGDGLTFRKRILPLAEINYPKTSQHPGGRQVFDRDYHQKLIDAHRDGAYDNPTVQLASNGVEHNSDVRLTAGSIIELSHARPDDEDGPGLYATIRAHSKKDAKLFRKNPNVGVSPEIVENRTRVDGKHYPAAVHHVLATLRGRVAGLGPWRAVSLSSSDEGTVIDLSDAEFKEIPVGKSKNKKREDESVVSLSESEIETALAAAVQQLKDEPEAQVVDLADGGPSIVRLGAQVTETQARIDGMSARLAASDWAARRAEHSRAGVPKKILDLAEDVLGFPGETVVSLADEDGQPFTVEARPIIEGMLNEFRGIISLSDTVPGSGEDPTSAAVADEAVRAQLADWASRSGS